ncbi:hypothetical protein EBL87_15320 [Cereibacter sphaeroides]|uniref:hypothetical protein n=1 Tax=Cereibacter sphaeroides TaxID=1063 RepID=UPI000F54A804|nr:hypothetical protein [Cereibacter sphaeroides]AZB65043.1 hypothetical protein EBL87_15320 [Cereibacter sphaeroides]AZB67073.1 hypothetical protein EBL86_01090 [Cereibacter sphaeroides]
MQITFSPQRRDGALILARAGDSLILNGEVLDMSGIPDGATLPRDAVGSEWLASDIERIEGVLHLTLILPHGPDADAATLFPAPVHAETDGPISVPAWAPEPAAEEA